MILREWEIVGRPISQAMGFIYLTICNGKYYVGKKTMFNKRTRPPLKGKKRRRVDMVDSNWRKYYGSSKKLDEHLQQAASDEPCKRFILHFCKNKSEMALAEVYYQTILQCLEDERCLNGQIKVYLGKSNLGDDIYKRFVIGGKTAKETLKNEL